MCHRLFTTVLGIAGSLGLMLAGAQPAFARGECGESCGLAGAEISGINLAPHVGMSLQYEYTTMDTLREGRDKVSPDAVIARNQLTGSSYSVPLTMDMRRISMLAAWSASDRWQVMGVVPYVRNDMTMRMKSSMGMVMDRAMDRVEGLGDASLLGLYTLYADMELRPTRKITLGAGLKLPTGKNDVTTSSGSLVHAMMQPGSGSWDPIFMLNALRAWYPLVLQGSLYYQWTTEGDQGYEFGNQFACNLVARYKVAKFVNVGLELNGLATGKDTDHDGKYSRPATSMLDNTRNTGLVSVFATPHVQVLFLGTAGCGMELRTQFPVYQNADGFQAVVDWRVLVSMTWTF